MRFVIATAALAGAAIASAAVALTPHRAHAQSMDRYGGSAPGPATPSARYAQAQYTPPAPGAAGAGLRMLTWPGKSGGAPAAQPQAYAPPPAAAPPQPYAAPQAYRPVQAYAPPPPRFAPPPPYPPSAYASNPGAVLPQSGGVQPRPTVLRPVPAEAPLQPAAPTAYPPAAYAPAAYAPAAARPPAPTSIYSDAPAAAPVAAATPRPAQMGEGRAVAANTVDLTPAQRAALLPPPNTDSRARLYSLHRDYGMTPDAAPIPPAFFAATADLTTPETPEAAPRNTSTAAKAAQNAARLAATSGQ